jgi:hypothetical protein
MLEEQKAMRGRPKKTNRERIHDRIELRDGCWLWKLSIGNKSSPMFEFWVDGKTRNRPVRRQAWLEFKGPIPEGMNIHRTCTERRCVNPEHAALKAGVPLGFCQRGHSKEVHGRWNAKAKSLRCTECERANAALRLDRLRSTLAEKDGRLVSLLSTKWRAERLRNKYGITVGDFAEMFERQGGGCAVCRCELTSEPSKRNTANVDHCHQTGKVRGLLCTFCNAAIGYLRDDPANAESAAAYLRNSVERRDDVSVSVRNSDSLIANDRENDNDFT